MSLDAFHPLIRQWFQQRLGDPTEPQKLGWPSIRAGQHTLIAAPTGSGKTLAAFLVCLDRLMKQWLAGTLDDSLQVVYISPLKALSNDIERNLQVPLAEIAKMFGEAGLGTPSIRAAVRTGDTPASQRQKIVRQPPHILVTTPESLYLMLTSEKSRDVLKSVRTVIVDEIHALARDKRGSHLALSLERLSALCEVPPVRIGLSATQKPIDEIASFLVGQGASNAGSPADPATPQGQNADSNQLDGHQAVAAEAASPAARPVTDCVVVDAGHVRDLDLALEVPPSELAAVCSLEQWDEVYERLVELVNAHRSTLIFVNTRRLAERVAHRLTEILGEESVASHHGSLSRDIRLSAEQRLKAGQLKAIVATASLEMGIDIGYIDLVCQIGSPRNIATFLQRVGRSGHSLGKTPKGRLFPLTRDELLESMALIRAVRRGELDRIEIPEQPLDILAQQIIAAVACEDWDETALYELCRRAWPYRNLSRDDYDAIIKMVSEGLTPRTQRGAYLHRDQINHRLRARRHARLAAITSGGAIPETAEYRVVTDGEKTFVGTVDEDFAIESMAGDVFLLGNTSWRISAVRGGEVIVRDAGGAPPTIPFWLGEAPGRTVELSTAISELRSEIAQRLPSVAKETTDHSTSTSWLEEQCGANAWAASQAVCYVETQVAAVGLVPTHREILFERFFDESGGMQLVIHAPLGMRINRAWGLAMRKRFCRSFDFELQAAANDNGVLLSLSPQHSFPIEQLFKMLGPHNGKQMLEQALLAVPMFQVRWRWNITRALAVLRTQGGKKVPPFLQKFRAEDLLAATFPETVGCLENHHGDIEIPDHPLVRQTMHDCLHEAMDLDRWLIVLRDVQEGRVQLVARDTREPSPFSHELINANPYAFLDGAPLEERRTRAVTTRRSLNPADFRDLTRLDPDAIAQVKTEAWPIVRSSDELHDALLNMVMLFEEEGAPWRAFLDELVRAGRATTVWLGPRITGSGDAPIQSNLCWIAAERWPVIRAVYPDAQPQPAVTLPTELDLTVSRSDGWVELVRGRMQYAGPLASAQLANQLQLDESQVTAALEALEGQGVVLRGQFGALLAPALAGPSHAAESPDKPADRATEWCDRRLLARIHRLTLDGLRKSIQPVGPADAVRFLVRHQRLSSDQRWQGPLGVREAVGQMQGFEMPAGAWESVLSARVADYDPQWLDQLFLTGEVMWGRLRPPRRDESDGPSMAALSRTVPISLVLREDLPWLLPAGRPDVSAFARPNAQQILAILATRGALFFSELKLLTGLLPAHLEEGLRELAALGLITSDAFAAIRSLVAGDAPKHRLRRRARAFSGIGSPVGRWSLFPGTLAPAGVLTGAAPGSLEPTRGAAPDKARFDHWTRLLLRRYGVVFRDLLARETAAPSWHEMVPTLRRLELRGEIRGGRFVGGVSGEQFAVESVVGQLRQVRDEGAAETSGAAPTSDAATDWFVISASDPLNLSGLIDAGPRVPATHTNTMILRHGVCIAAKRGGQIEFFDEIDPASQLEMRRALIQGRRRAPTAHMPEHRLHAKSPALRAAT